MDLAESKNGAASASAAHSARPLTLRIKLLYGAPSFAGAAMIIPIFIHMPKFYADVVLVPLGYLAMAIAIARSLDALSDPLMGWISDHTHTRLGRRRPYMLLGAPLCGVAFFALLNPPESLTGGGPPGVVRGGLPLDFLFSTVYLLPRYARRAGTPNNDYERFGPYRVSVTGAIRGTMMPCFNAYVIRPKNPGLWLSILLIGYFAFGFLSLPMWVAIAHRVGKLKSYLASTFFPITGGAAMFFIGQGDEWICLALICWAGIGFGAGLFLTPSMQADVIDYDELYTRKRREAQYSAFWSMLPTFVAIPSAAVPIAILASMGYVPNAIQSPPVVFAIRTIFALRPAAFALLSFLLARKFRMPEKIHVAILDGIDRRNVGEAALDPMTGLMVPPPKRGRVEDDAGWFLDYFSAGGRRRYLLKATAL